MMPKRILVIQTWGLGDVLMTVSLLKLTRARFPQTTVELLVGPSGVGTILSAAGLVDEIHHISSISPTGLARTFLALRPRAFDAAIVATRLSWVYSAMARFVAGIPFVITDIDRPLVRWYSTHVCTAGTHRFLSNGLLLRPLLPDLSVAEIECLDGTLPIGLSSGRASAFLAGVRDGDGGRCYAIHLGSGSQPVKRVPPHLALDVLRRIEAADPQARFLYIEGKGDPVLGTLPHDLQRKLVRVADWPIEDVLYLLRECDSVLTGDTGIAHLTAATGGRAIVLAGPSDVARTAPWGRQHAIVVTRDPPSCMPCYGTPLFEACPYGVRCMSSISPDDVCAALTRPPHPQ